MDWAHAALRRVDRPDNVIEDRETYYAPDVVDEPACPDRDAARTVPAAAVDTTPLYVDCDGTLITTDLLWESLLGTIRHNPAQLWRVPGWLLAGKAALKSGLAGLGAVDVTLVPLHEPVLAAIREARAAGRPVILATAADRSLAEALAEHLGLFDAVLASDGATSLSGTDKLAASEADAAARQGGATSFDYIGDTRADAPILAKARTGFVITRSTSVPGFAREASPITVAGRRTAAATT